MRMVQGCPGVNVIIKGTTVGTVTDTEGYYSLAADFGRADSDVFIRWIYTRMKSIFKTGMLLIIGFEQDVESTG